MDGTGPTTLSIDDLLKRYNAQKPGNEGTINKELDPWGAEIVDIDNILGTTKTPEVPQPNTNETFDLGLPQTPKQEYDKEPRMKVGEYLQGLGSKLKASGASLGEMVTEIPQGLEAVGNLPSILLSQAMARRALKRGEIDKETADFLVKEAKDLAPQQGLGQLIPTVGKSVETIGDKLANGKLNEWFSENNKRLSEEGDKYDKTIIQYIKSGQFGKALGATTYGIAESLAPTLAAAFVPGGPAFLGLGTGAQQYDEVKDREDMSEAQKVANAVSQGIFEWLFEELGTKEMSQFLQKIYKERGKEGIKMAFKSPAMQNLFAKAYKRFGVWFASIHEGLSEVLTTLGQNASAKFSCEDPNRKITDGAWDSFIIGTGMGSMFAAGEKTAEKTIGRLYKPRMEQTGAQVTGPLAMPEPDPEQMIRDLGRKYAFVSFNDEQPENNFIKFADLKDGRKVILTNINDPLADPQDMVLTAIDATNPEGQAFMVKGTEIMESKDVPYEEWVANELNNYNVTKQQMNNLVAKINPPVKEGATLTVGDKLFNVTEVTDNGITLNEIDENGNLTGNTQFIPPDLYESVFGMGPTEQPTGQTTVAQQIPQEKYDETQPSKPNVRTISDGKNKFNIAQREDGTYAIEQVYNTQKSAETVKNKLKELYPKLTWGIQIIDSGDPFTPDEYRIIAKAKQTKKEESKNAERSRETNQAVAPQSAPQMGQGETGERTVRNDEQTRTSQPQEEEVATELTVPETETETPGEITQREEQAPEEEMPEEEEADEQWDEEEEEEDGEERKAKTTYREEPILKVTSVTENTYLPKGAVGSLTLIGGRYNKNLTEEYPDLAEITDETIRQATPLQMWYLAQMSHPTDHGFKVTRLAVLSEFERRGKDILEAIGYPTELDYPYKHTWDDFNAEYGGITTVGMEIGKDKQWWVLIERNRPVTDIEKEIQEQKKNLKTLDKLDSERTKTQKKKNPWDFYKKHIATGIAILEKYKQGGPKGENADQRAWDDSIEVSDKWSETPIPGVTKGDIERLLKSDLVTRKDMTKGRTITYSDSKTNDQIWFAKYDGQYKITRFKPGGGNTVYGSETAHKDVLSKVLKNAVARLSSQQEETSGAGTEQPEPKLEAGPEPRALSAFVKGNMVQNTQTGKQYKVVSINNNNARLQGKDKKIENFAVNKKVWVPVKVEKKLTARKGWPVSKEDQARLSRTPETFDEAVLQFLLGGGRISMEDYYRHFGHNNSERIKNIWMYSKTGIKLDKLNETVFAERPDLLASIGDGAMDQANAFVDVIRNYFITGKNDIRKALDTLQGAKEEETEPQMNPEEEDMLNLPVEIENSAPELTEDPAIIAIFENEIKQEGRSYDWLKEKAEADPGYFKLFPYGLNDNQFNELKKIFNDPVRLRKIQEVVDPAGYSESRSQRDDTNAGVEPTEGRGPGEETEEGRAPEGREAPAEPPEIRLTPETKIVYTSAEDTFQWPSFVEREVTEYHNYTLDEVNKWKEKYGITDEDDLIWVTPDKWMANRYNLNAEDWETHRQVPEDQLEIREINLSDGFIIPESDDGDNGYLFVYRKPVIIKAEPETSGTEQARAIVQEISSLEKPSKYLKDLTLPNEVESFFNYLKKSPTSKYTWSVYGKGFKPFNAYKIKNFFLHVHSALNGLPGDNPTQSAAILGGMGFDLNLVEKAEYEKIWFKNGVFLAIESGKFKGDANHFYAGTQVSLEGVVEKKLMELVDKGLITQEQAYEIEGETKEEAPQTEPETRSAIRVNPEAIKYINAIRNENKKAYAKAYHNYILKGKPQDAYPEKPEGLGEMGAQSVRMELRKFYPEVKTPIEAQKPEFAGEMFEKPKEEVETPTEGLDKSQWTDIEKQDWEYLSRNPEKGIAIKNKSELKDYKHLIDQGLVATNWDGGLSLTEKGKSLIEKPEKETVKPTETPQPTATKPERRAMTIWEDRFFSQLESAYSVATSDWERNKVINDIAYSLAGPNNVISRQQLLEYLTGNKPTKANAGVTVLAQELKKWIKERNIPELKSETEAPEEKPTEKPEETPEKAPEAKEYRYKMTARPFDVGTYPKEGFVRSENDPEGGYQILVYNKKLTPQEWSKWDFLPIDEINALKGKEFKDKDGYYSKITLNWYGNNKGANVSLYDTDGNLVEQPFGMSAKDILKNIEDGEWIAKPSPLTNKPFVYTKERYPFLTDEEIAKMNDFKANPNKYTREDVQPIFDKIDKANRQTGKKIETQAKEEVINPTTLEGQIKNLKLLLTYELSQEETQATINQLKDLPNPSKAERDRLKANQLTYESNIPKIEKLRAQVDNNIIPEDKVTEIRKAFREKVAEDEKVSQRILRLQDQRDAKEKELQKRNELFGDRKQAENKAAGMMDLFAGEELFKPTSENLQSALKPFNDAIKKAEEDFRRNEQLFDEKIDLILKGAQTKIDYSVPVEQKAPETALEALNQAPKESPLEEEESSGDGEDTPMTEQDAQEEKEAFMELENESESIQDFGKKIGGARKDVALKKELSQIKGDKAKQPRWMKGWNLGEEGGTYKPFKTTRLGSISNYILYQSKKVLLTEEDAIKHIKTIEVLKKFRISSKGDKTVIYRRTGLGGHIIKEFTNEAEAGRWLYDNIDELLNYRAKFPERPHLDKIERTGKQYRTGNVTTQMFHETFGFSGGEFGNWVPQDERQTILNLAYDGLMDLADALGLPPKALSLNGQLSVAFGARGHGSKRSAAAHYERDRAVFNLTRIHGAGAVAHEWFHALDHYLGAQDKGQTLEKDENGIVKAAKGRDSDFLSHGYSYRSAARPELVGAFNNIVKTMSRQPKEIEVNIEKLKQALTWRQAELMQYLTEYRTYLEKGREWGKKKNPATPEQMKRYDELVDKIRNGDYGKEIEYETKEKYIRTRKTFENILEIDKIYKDVTGISQLKRDASLDRASTIARLIQGIKTDIEKYTDNPRKIADVQTDYHISARDIDQRRGSAYWATPHEMAARAFEAYVEDKITGKGNISQYLVHSTDGKLYELLYNGANPYPKDEERKKINEAFDKLFTTIQVVSDDTNIAKLQERAEEYITKNGVYKNSPVTFLEGVDAVSEREANPQLEIWGSSEATGYNSTEEEGDISEVVETNVERFLTEWKRATFMGHPLTGAPEIRNFRDVAYLFKNLESASTENSFAVLVKPDHTYKVLYISTGVTTSTLVEQKAIITAAKEFGAKDVFFVHNHPSGRLSPSDGDVMLHRKLKASLSNIGVELQDSVIIDLDSGEYGVFHDAYGEERTLDKENYEKTMPVSSVELYRFDRQKLYVPSASMTQIRSSSDVATYLSKMKRGAIPKLHAIILGRSNNITKYLLFDETIDTDKLISELTYEISKHGEAVILASNRSIPKDTIMKIHNGISSFGSQLLDVIEIKQADDITNNYMSYADEGKLMEPEVPYLTASKTASVIDTPAFKRWFGKSVVVDAKGDPMVMYHGTNYDFDIFDGKQGIAAFLTPDPDFAEEYAYTFNFGSSIMPVFVRAENPFDYNNQDHLNKIYPEVDRTIPNPSLADKAKQAIAHGDWAMIETFSNEIKNLGFDGMWVIENGTRNLAVFSPTQVKSATGNTGEFNRFDPSIVNDPGGSLFRTSDDIYVSNTQRALGTIKQNKATAQQWKTMLLNNGAKQAEMDWMGWDDFFQMDKPTYTREEVQSWIDNNKIRIREIEKGADRRRITLNLKIEELLTRKGQMEQAMQSEEAHQRLLPEYLRLGQEIDRLQEEKERQHNATKYSKYTIPGGEDYKELLLVLPETNTIDKEKFIEWYMNRYDYTREKAEANLAELELEEQAGAVRLSAIREQYAKEMGLPPEPEPFRSSHWAESNVFAHVRLNSRTNIDGKNILLLEEVQSDWAQKGRRKGFYDRSNVAQAKSNRRKAEEIFNDSDKRLLDVIEEMHDMGLPAPFLKHEIEWFSEGDDRYLKAINQEYRALSKTQEETRDHDEYDIIAGRLKEIQNKYIELGRQYRKAKNEREEAINKLEQADNELISQLHFKATVPDMPWKNTDQWAGLILRRMIRYAIDNGYDSLAWTTGETQSARHHLSEQIGAINVDKVQEWKKKDRPQYDRLITAIPKDGDRVDRAIQFIIDKEGTVVEGPAQLYTKDLDEIVGKEMADKILKAELGTTFRDLDLDINNKGMIGFYDQILPAIANKIAKKYGVKVDDGTVITGDGADDMGHYISSTKVHSLPITDKMLEDFRQGVPMFRRGYLETPKYQGGWNKLAEVLAIDERTDWEAEAKDKINALSEELNTPVIIINNRNELPRRIQAEAKRTGIWNNQALYGVRDSETGSIYIILDELYNLGPDRGLVEAVKTVLHEVVAHKGLPQLLGEEEYNRLLDEIYESIPRDDKLLLQYDYGTKDRITIAKEYLAMMAEDNVNPNLFQRILAKIRQIIRKLFKINYTTNDIHNLLRESRKNLQKSKAGDYEFAGDYLNSSYRTTKARKDTVLGRAAEAYQEKEAVRTGKETIQGIREYIQDMNLPVRKFEEEVLKRGGVQDNTSKPYRDMSLSFGRQEKLYTDYFNNKMKPILEAVANIKREGIPGEEILPYIIAKHAQERNPVFRGRELREWVDSQKDNISLEEIEEKKEELKNKDYSGVMGFDTENKYDNPDKLAADIVKEFEDQVDKKLINDLWSKINDATSSILDTWEKGGQISPEQKDEYLNQFHFFVPLRGWREGAAKELVYTKGEGFSRSLQHAEGRKSLADNPLAYLLNVEFQAITEQVDNEVKTAMYNLILKNLKNNEIHELATIKKLYYVKIILPDGSEEWEPTINRPPQEMFDSGDAKTKIYHEYQRLRKPRDAREHEVLVRKPGGDMVLVFKGKQLSVAQALNKQNYMYRTIFGHIYDARDLNKVMALMGNTNNMLKALYTSWNVVFPFTNFIRDFQEASITQSIKSKAGKKVLSSYKDAFPAIMRRLKGEQDLTKKIDQDLEDFYNYGGATGYTHMKTPEEIEKDINNEIRKMVRKGTISGDSANTLADLARAIEQWNRLFEDATRFSVYLSSLAVGNTKEDAAYDAKEASVNFNRKGKGSKAWDAWFAFFNVAIQSMQKNFKLAKDYPGRFSKVAFSFVMLGFLEALMNAITDDPDDPDSSYYNLNPYMRQNYLIIPLPKLGEAKKSNKYFSVPLPQFWRGFKSIGSISFDVATGKMKVGEAVMSALGDFAAALLPIDVGGFFKSGEFSLAPIFPTIIKPVVELAENRNYMGYTIKKEPFTREQKKYLANAGLGKDNVNPAAKFFTDLLFRWSGGDTRYKYYVDQKGRTRRVLIDINPSSLEHLITGYTGGTGGVISDLITTVVQALKPEEELDFKNIPFVNRFIRQTPEAKWNIISDYYNIKSDDAKDTAIQKEYERKAHGGGDATKYVNMSADEFRQIRHELILDYDKEIKDLTADKTKDDVETANLIIELMDQCVNQVKDLEIQYKKKY